MATELEPSYSDSSGSTGYHWPKHRSVEYHTYSSNRYMQSNGPTRDHYRDNNGHNQMGSTQYSPYQSNEGPEHIECTPDMELVIAAQYNYEQDKIIDRELTARNRCARCFRHNTLNFIKYHDCYWQDCKCSECTKLVGRQINRKLSLNMGITSKPGPKPRAANSPGSGSTTSTTTGPGRDKMFVCQVCNRSFGYKNVLQNHERTHTGEKPFECRECHKKFTQDQHLKTHMRLHTGEKSYHCDHCERQFVQVANLRRHLRVHTGERPYPCQICPSKFADSNLLKAHNLIHKGEKPFACTKCHGKFRQTHHLKYHKCPNDAENIGKPRRGRRSTAYDELDAVSPAARLRPNSRDETHIPVVATAATVTSSAAATAAAVTSSSFYHHIPSVAQSTSSSMAKLMAITTGLSLESDPSESRRKSRQSIRILTPQHRDFHREFHIDRDIQTQAVNLSLGSSHRDDSLNGKSESIGCQCLQFPCIKVLENSPNEFGQKAFEANDKAALVNQQDNQSEFSLNEKIEDEGVLDFILDYCA